MENGKILATVAGKAITGEDVAQFLAALGERGAAYNNPEGHKIILEELIANQLFLAEAKKNMMEYEDGFKAKLATIKDRLLIDYAMEKALGKITVSDADVKKYYDEHKEEMMCGETVGASHILCKEKTQAEELLQKINAGQISFEDAAKEYSTCPSGQNGGDLGTFGRGQMVPEFENACYEMQVGEVRGPIETQFGFHIIRLNAKNSAATVPFEQVKGEIKNRLLSEKQQAAYRSKINQLGILFPVDRY